MGKPKFAKEFLSEVRFTVLRRELLSATPYVKLLKSRMGSTESSFVCSVLRLTVCEEYSVSEREKQSMTPYIPIPKGRGFTALFR